MPLVRDYQQVKDVYQQAGELGVALPVFCAEDRETLEAILASALSISQKIGVDDLPIIPAWTSRYPARGQMTLLSACGDPLLGNRLMFSDLETFMGRLAPERQPWHRHTLEGPDDSPSHMRSMLTDTSMSIPIDGGKLSLGTWQGVYLFEHRDASQRRRVLVRCLDVG